jgi:hypothetical protein
MSLFVPAGGGAWSPEIAPGRLWVRNGPVWNRVLVVHVRGGDPESWVQVYRWPGVGPAMADPTGFVATYIDSTEVRLVVTNRFETWRLQGEVQMYTGGVFQSSAPINVLADLFSVADPGITNGEVRFTVKFRNPDTDVESANVVFSQFLGLES